MSEENPGDRAVSKLAEDTENVFATFERFEDRVLQEIGFTSPKGRLIARRAEMVLGAGMVIVGTATAELGVGLPLAVGGLVLVGDAGAGALLAEKRNDNKNRKRE